LDFWDEFGNDFLVLKVPNADRGLGSGAEPEAVGREGNLVDGFVAFEFIEEFTTAEIPELGNAVLSSGCAQAAVGGDSHGGDDTLVSTESRETLEFAQAPDLDEVVPTSRNDEGCSDSGGEANAADPVGVAVTVLHGVHAVTLDVPHLELGVAAARDNLTVIRGEGAGENVAGVTLELGDAVACLEVPEAESLVPRSGEGEFTVVGQSNVLNEATVAFKAAERGQGVSIVAVAVLTLPANDRLVARCRDDTESGGIACWWACEGCDPSAVSFKLTFVREVTGFRHLR
jgi:hypothetical protein